MPFVLEILYQGALAGLLALSFAVVFVPTRIWHFAHGGVYVLAAVVFWWANSGLGWSVLPASVLAIVASGIAGGLIHRGLYAPLERRGVLPLVIVIASIGLMTVMGAIAQLLLGPGGEGVSYTPHAVYVFGAYANTDMFAALALVVLLYVGGRALLNRSRFGAVLRAMVTSRSFLALRGIDTERLATVAFVMGSCLVAVPAILLAADSGVQASGGTEAVLIAAMGVFLAGTETILGALGAGFLLGVIGQVGGLLLSYQWQDAIMFAAAALFLLIRPAGFSQALRRVV